MNTIHTVGVTKVILSHANVDADGSPRAYAPKNSPLHAEDYLANAGHPGNWWAVVTNRFGLPAIQASGETAGYYVSTTSLEDRSEPVTSPLHWVNSEAIPFCVIPSSPKFGIEVGDLGFAWNIKSGHSIPLLVADIGPANQFGEVSIFAANHLGLNDSAKVGGTDENIILYALFIGSRFSWTHSTTPNDIGYAASTLLEKAGGAQAIMAVIKPVLSAVK